MWAIRFSLHHFSRVFLETPNSFAAAAVEYRLNGITPNPVVSLGVCPGCSPALIVLPVPCLTSAARRCNFAETLHAFGGSMATTKRHNTPLGVRLVGLASDLTS